MKRNSKGFTIIEVLIVLAIAGVIILGVLIAVPTLQRNNRNSARTSEASRIAALINQCLSNRNGQVADSCDTMERLQINKNEFQQFDTLDNFQIKTTPLTADMDEYKTDESTSTPLIQFGAQCSENGAYATKSSSGNRSFVILFGLEGSSKSKSGRCVSS